MREYRWAAGRLPGAATLLLATTLAGVAACGPGRTEDAASESHPDDGSASRPGTTLWHPGPPLPQPLSNNAVAAVTVNGTAAVFTFAGIDSTKAWSGVTNAAYRWDVGAAAWRSIEPVPGPGRLAATAQVVDGRVYVFGGYTVAEDGSESSLPDVAVYDPVAEAWSRGADIPVPTDDAVSGVWGDSLIVLVSGWHDTDNIPDVQIYDPATDSWSAGPPIVGAPVFGHVGAVVDDRIVYGGGAAVVRARPRFRIDSTSWIGRLERAGSAGPDGRSGSAWTELAGRPGPPLYRAAGGTIGGLAVFLGGTDNPYNYTGIGYDGVAAEPVRQIVTYDPDSATWGSLVAPPEPTMDHRNLPTAGGRAFLVGGMVRGQRVSDHVWWADVEDLLATAGRADGDVP